MDKDKGKETHKKKYLLIYIVAFRIIFADWAGNGIINLLKIHDWSDDNLHNNRLSTIFCVYYTHTKVL